LALGSSVSEVLDESCIAHAERVVQILKDYNNDDGRQFTVSANEENVREKKQFSDALILLTEAVKKLRESIRTVTNPCVEMNIKDISYFKMLVTTAEAWTLLGFLQVTLYSNLGLMDPVAKKKQKLQYVSEEVSIVTQTAI
jgi:hypothetical protein